MPNDVLLVMSTFPDRGKAQRIAEELVAGRYAACANVASVVDSFYWWKGEIETANEVLVYFKTTAARFDAFAQKLRELHPYDLPEIVALRLENGSPEYLSWVEENSQA
ncbi:MAG TPA: divalent-cation tolerance protein CutA [Chthoniobacterales bacterium]|nr:divalent-cation tolerance protein CutA [Chthoniobacterales bacterium]